MVSILVPDQEYWLLLSISWLEETMLVTYELTDWNRTYLSLVALSRHCALLFQVLFFISIRLMQHETMRIKRSQKRPIL